MNRDEEEDLLQRYAEDRLDADEIAALEAGIRDSETFRRRFADRLHQEGVLRAEADALFSDAAEDLAATSQPLRFGWKIAAAAALLVIGLGVGWRLGPSSGSTSDTGNAVAVATPAPVNEPAEPVATLADTKSAKWGAGSLPTREGARLRPGQLELLEGLATVRFDSGATVTLEAPAALEIDSATRCRLINGAAVTWVPKGAEGFQVETEDALLTDYGTRFGVTAGRDGHSEVLVLEGEVGVAHRRGDGEKRLAVGEMVRYDAENMTSVVADGEGETARFGERPGIREEGWKVLTTGQGRGMDSYARRDYTTKIMGDAPLLMVKNSAAFPGLCRKAWLSFDLSGIDQKSIAASELVLSVQPSGLGYASVVPDATFAVYGLLDESTAAIWDEATLLWANAPANVVDHGSQLDPNRTVLLGEFVVEQGVSSGLRKVSGDSVSNFLRSRGDGLATFIVVRLTDETGLHGLVHAFASAEHPAAMPPTLRLRLK